MSSNEFGETPKVYVFPVDHEEGQPYPEDFWKRVQKGLDSVGLDYETV